MTGDEAPTTFIALSAIEDEHERHIVAARAEKASAHAALEAYDKERSSR